jgi:hypothetical protein
MRGGAGCHISSISSGVRNGSVNEIVISAACLGQSVQRDSVADVPRSVGMGDTHARGGSKDGAEDFLAPPAGYVPVPEGARVFEILESHAHKLRRWTIGEVGGTSRQRQPGSDALQFIEQVLVLAVAETPAHVMPIFDLRLEKPQSTLGDSDHG